MNANRGSVGSMPGKSKTYSKKNVAMPERGGEGEDHRPDQDQRRDHGPQQGHQDQEDDHERDRHDHLVVA